MRRKHSKPKRRKTKYRVWEKNQWFDADKEQIDAIERVWHSLVKRGVIV